MNEKQTTLEIIAPTIDEAVTKGLEELGLPLEAVDVEILDEGSRGLFGIGTRQARVRLAIKDHPEAARTAPAPPAERPKPAPTPRAEEPYPEPEVTLETSEDDEVLSTARETVSELLEKMHIQAEVTASYRPSEDPHRHPPVIVDVHGKDLSVLIGRKAATLNALQYIARLIVGKELQRSVLLIVDVEGYRARRERQLQRLAQRMAEQAINTGRRQILEPMPANERRIVHISLRDNPDVQTESIGEEPRRKVTILPVR